MVIYKFELQPFEVARYDLPTYAEPISVINQSGAIQLYCKMDMPRSNGTRERYFGCFPTGDSEEFPGLKGRIPIGRCLGTVQLNVFVLHIFEVKPQ